MIKLPSEHMARWIDTKLRDITEVPITPQMRRSYGLEDDEAFEAWCREHGLAFTPPLFAGLSYIVHRTRRTRV
jgi:hypothetical protein